MNAPPSFYKYRPVAGKASEYLERTILHDEIRFSFPHEFNDPFDCSVVYAQHRGTEAEVVADFIGLGRKVGATEGEEELRKEALRILQDPLRDPRREEVCREMERSYAFWVRGQIGVYCVSAVADDILMWAHYGQYHEGVCLQFVGGSASFRTAQRIRYSKLRPQLEWKDSNRAKLEKTLLTKSSHWAYEQEWRLIEPGAGGTVVRFHPTTLSGIIVGAKASAATMQLVRRLNKARRTPLDVFKAFLSPTTYEVELRPVSPT